MPSGSSTFAVTMRSIVGTENVNHLACSPERNEFRANWDSASIMTAVFFAGIMVAPNLTLEARGTSVSTLPKYED